MMYSPSSTRIATEDLREELTAAKQGTSDALKAAAQYKDTLESLECQLNASVDAQKMHCQQVRDAACFKCRCVKSRQWSMALNLIDS